MVRVFFEGLGSIGQRHIKNLAAELRARGLDFEIDALRSSQRELPEQTAALVSRQYADIRELPGGYDIAYITNPTSLHAASIAAAVPKARALFIEKPVFADPATDIASLGLREDGVYYVACPLRHNETVKRAIAFACENRAVAARAICSSYLPGWRRTGDYRECYSARRDMGGGVELDLVHEWDYLAAAFGFPDEVRAFGGKCSALETDSDDVAVYIARYPAMLLSLHLDYVGRLPRRELEIYTDEETRVFDIARGEIRELRSGKAESAPGGDFYAAETSYFLSLALGGPEKNINTPRNAARVLSLACAALDERRGS